MQPEKKRRLKVLITLPSLWDEGGVAGFFNMLLPHLGREEDVEVSYVEIGSTKGRGAGLHPLRDLFRFSGRISAEKFDLVHVNPSLCLKSFFRDGLFIWLAKRKKIPVLVFFHGWSTRFEKDISGKFSWLFGRTFGKADSFIVLASDFKKKLKEWGITAPVSLETTAFKESEIEGFSIEKNIEELKAATRIKILYLARVEKRKGIFETFEALEKLISRGHDVELTVAGNGSIMREVKEYIEDRGLKERVSFAGWLRGDDKVKAFKDNHIYCFPTFSGEGMPISLLEAMAFGMPVVTRAVAGIGDMFEEGRMGYLLEGMDTDVLADLIERLITDRDGMARMSAYNHKVAAERFVAGKVAARVAEKYRETHGAREDRLTRGDDEA